MEGWLKVIARLAYLVRNLIGEEDSNGLFIGSASPQRIDGSGPGRFYPHHDRVRVRARARIIEPRYGFNARGTWGNGDDD